MIGGAERASAPASRAVARGSGMRRRASQMRDQPKIIRALEVRLETGKAAFRAPCEEAASASDRFQDDLLWD